MTTTTKATSTEYFLKIETLYVLTCGVTRETLGVFFTCALAQEFVKIQSNQEPLWERHDGHGVFWTTVAGRIRYTIEQTPLYSH